MEYLHVRYEPFSNLFLGENRIMQINKRHYFKK